MFTGIIVVAVSLALSLILYGFNIAGAFDGIFDRFKKPATKPLEAAKVPRCVGYNWGTAVFHDCRAHRSKHCEDGRCRYHCGKDCKCEALDVPAMQRYMKKAG